MVSNCCGATPIEMIMNGRATCEHCNELTDFVSVDEPEKPEEEKENE
tara:strand:- start:109 stop:249 length:141 start_codon:yes stop_codon:yes gene_type:complete